MSHPPERAAIAPPSAVEEVVERWDDGTPREALYYLEGAKVARRFWDEAGHLYMEYGLLDEVQHGPFRVWHENSVLLEESYYLNGVEHGTERQYDWEGNLIGTYEMVHGTGADLWYCSKGVLAEERYLVNGERHGCERWWSGDNQSVWSEQHFKRGIEHGIYREWNSQGRLRRGFPRYFVEGKQVTRRQYLKAAEQDPTLPSFLAEENQPQRPLPLHLMREV